MHNNYTEVSWQASRDSLEKFEIIEPILKKKNVTSVLDVGCNAGEITRLAGKAGYFAVGIDKVIDFRGFNLPLQNACIGNIELGINDINKLPIFDAVFLLSVHHQLIASKGDNYTRNFIYKLSELTNKVLMIEFAALNRKYNYNKCKQFLDNDKNSIISYAMKWLSQSLINYEINYIGKASNTIVEPYRFIFSCDRKKEEC